MEQAAEHAKSMNKNVVPGHSTNSQSEVYTFQVISGDRSCINDGKTATKAGLIAIIDHLDVNQDVFNGLGILKNFVYDAELIDNPEFLIHAARNIPFNDRKEAKKEVLKMVVDGVTTCVAEATDTVSPMVIDR
ncbi:hypothetical protein DMENIID0001_141580 [Sergentomyia squamirostris]